MSLASVLQIHCLNVGQGDATLVVSPTGRTMLIDAGYDSLGIKKVLPWLDSLGIRSLDWVVATHYHADHIGGLDEVISGLGQDSIKQAVFDRGWSYSTSAYEDYVQAAGAKRRTITENIVLDLGAGAIATCLGLNGNYQLTEPFTDPPWSENDLSIALRISYGRFDFSISGDLSGESTPYYRDIETSVAPEIGPVEVLRVNHHGSEYSSNPHFCSTLSPLASVISCGKNDYGHPNPGVVSRLRSYGPVYQTADRRGRAVDGDIVITTNGSSFVIEDDTFECKVGVAETEGGKLPTLNIGPTICRGKLLLPPSLFSAHYLLLTSSGRKALTLRPGTNDVTRLPTGIYFAVTAPAHSLPYAGMRVGGSERTPGLERRLADVTKVVIVR